MTNTLNKSTTSTATSYEVLLDGTIPINFGPWFPVWRPKKARVSVTQYSRPGENIHPTFVVTLFENQEPRDDIRGVFLCSGVLASRRIDPRVPQGLLISDIPQELLDVLTELTGVDLPKHLPR